MHEHAHASTNNKRKPVTSQTCTVRCEANKRTGAPLKAAGPCRRQPIPAVLASAAGASRRLLGKRGERAAAPAAPRPRAAPTGLPLPAVPLPSAAAGDAKAAGAAGGGRKGAADVVGVGVGGGRGEGEGGGAERAGGGGQRGGRAWRSAQAGAAAAQHLLHQRGWQRACAQCQNFLKTLLTG